MRSYKPLIITILFLISSNIGSSQIVAPDFSVFTTHQDSFHLHEDYLDVGKVVLIEFFFTTCPPCAEISPFMEDLYQDWGGGDQNVEFILITNKSFDENSDVADYCDQYGFTFPGVGVDGGALGVWNTYKNSPWGSLFGTPAFIVLSPDGSVQYDVSGVDVQSTLDSLDAAISRALGPQPPPQVKYFDKILSTHYHSGDTIQNVFASFINYPQIGDTTVAPPVNGGDFTDFLPDSIPATASFSMEMKKHDGELLDGVSTFDLFFIQRGILGLDDLDFYQTVAADINDDGRLSGSDIIALRRVILELENSFPGRLGWRFFPDYIPDNTLDSLQYDQFWEFPDEWRYASEEENNGLLSFKGVKIGDVNHSWQSLKGDNAAKERSYHNAELQYIYNAITNAYDFYLVNVEGDLRSFQFDLRLPDAKNHEITSTLSSTNFFYNNIADDRIRLGFYDAYTRSISDHEVVFSLHLQENKVRGFTLENTELFDATTEPKKIQLRKLETSISLNVHPNPARDQISVFSNDQCSLKVIDALGKIILEVQVEKGWNNLDISQLNTGSYLIYKASTTESRPFIKL